MVGDQYDKHYAKARTYRSKHCIEYIESGRWSIMASMKQFWKGVRNRTTCANCGNDDLSLQRSHYERRGNFWCECGAEGTYYRTGKTSADRTAGDIRTDGVEHRPIVEARQ